MVHAIRLAAASWLVMAGGTSVAAEGDVWNLQKIVIVNELDAKADSYQLFADANGGYGSIKADGGLLDTCPGGDEVLLYGWTLPGAAQWVEGAAVPVMATASTYANAPCQAHIASNSFISIDDSKGITAALPEADMKTVDQDRFTTVNTPNNRAYPAGAQPHETAVNLLLSAYDPAPGRPYAYFMVRMLVLGSAGELKIVYLYSKDAPPLVPPTAGEALPPPG